MSTLTQFLTYAAWLVLLLGMVRILALLFAPRTAQEQTLLRLAEIYGQNPIGTAIMRTLILMLLCACWLFAAPTP